MSNLSIFSELCDIANGLDDYLVTLPAPDRPVPLLDLQARLDRLTDQVSERLLSCKGAREETP